MKKVEPVFASLDDMVASLAKLTKKERRRAPTWNERQAAAARERKRCKAVSEGHRRRRARIRAEKKRPATASQLKGCEGMRRAKESGVTTMDRVLLEMQPHVWYTKYEIEALIGCKRDWIGAILYTQMHRRLRLVRRQPFGGGSTGKRKRLAFALTPAGVERRERAIQAAAAKSS